MPVLRRRRRRRLCRRRRALPDRRGRPGLRHRRSRGRLLGRVPRLFHRPQFLSTWFRLVRKDCHD
ncbi:hypothetical protein SGPA1_21490 [Streptomyces misionensis JCM 4497]